MDVFFDFLALIAITVGLVLIRNRLNSIQDTNHETLLATWEILDLLGKEDGTRG